MNIYMYVNKHYVLKLPASHQKKDCEKNVLICFGSGDGLVLLGCYKFNH